MLDFNDNRDILELKEYIDNGLKYLKIIKYN